MWCDAVRGIAIGITAATVMYLVWITVNNDGVVTYRPLPLYADSHAKWQECVLQRLRKIDYSERMVWRLTPKILDDCSTVISTGRIGKSEELLLLPSFSDLYFFLPGAEYDSLKKVWCNPVLQLKSTVDDLEKRIFRNWLTRIVWSDHYMITKVKHSMDTNTTSITLVNVADAVCAVE